MSPRTETEQPAVPVWKARLRWGVLLGLPVLLVIYLFVDGGVGEYYALRGQLDSLQTRMNQLQQENEHLRVINRRLANLDSLQLEEEARRIGMIKPGDEVYHIRVED